MIADKVIVSPKSKITDKLYLADTTLYVVEPKTNYSKEILAYTGFVAVVTGILSTLSFIF